MNEEVNKRFENIYLVGRQPTFCDSITASCLPSLAVLHFGRGEFGMLWHLLLFCFSSYPRYSSTALGFHGQVLLRCCFVALWLYDSGSAIQNCGFVLTQFSCFEFYDSDSLALWLGVSTKFPLNNVAALAVS